MFVVRVAFLLILLRLTADVTLDPNPDQWFNSTENYANRVVYFFLGKEVDGSVFLQVEPPPYYKTDAKFLSAGIANVAIAKVLQTYTAEEVANLTDVDITFTVIANPNNNLNQGYQFYGQVFQWGVTLDPKNARFYSLQSVNITSSNGENYLKAPNYNADNDELTLYSDLLDYNTWIGFTDGIFLSPTLIYNYLFEETETAATESVTFTIRVDFSEIATLANGVYSLYFFFQMNALPLNQPFATTIQNTSDVQVVQINGLYNAVIGINSFLDGNNTLYDPIAADQVILNANKTTLVTKYNDTLDAMTIQWNAYAVLPNLTATSRNLITAMLNYIATARVNEADFTI